MRLHVSLINIFQRFRTNIKPKSERTLGTHLQQCIHPGQWRLASSSPTDKRCWLTLFLSAQECALRSTYASWILSWSHGFKEKWVGRELSAAAGQSLLLNVKADPEVADQQKNPILAWGNQAAQQPSSPPFWLFCVGVCCLECLLTGAYFYNVVLGHAPPGLDDGC